MQNNDDDWKTLQAAEGVSQCSHFAMCLLKCFETCKRGMFSDWLILNKTVLQIASDMSHSNLARNIAKK